MGLTATTLPSGELAAPHWAARARGGHTARAPQEQSMNQLDLPVQECLDYFTRQTKVIDESLAAWNKNPNNYELETDLAMACSPAALADVRGAGDKLWEVVEGYHRQWLEAIRLLCAHRGVEEEPRGYWLDRSK